MTTSERLAQLERAQIANNEQFTMLAGVIGSQGQDIKAMREDIKAMRTDMHSIAATLEKQGATLIEHTAILRAILDRLPPAKE